MLIGGVTPIYYRSIFERMVEVRLDFHQFNTYFFIFWDIHTNAASFNGPKHTKIFGGDLQVSTL